MRLTKENFRLTGVESKDIEMLAARQATQARKELLTELPILYVRKTKDGGYTTNGLSVENSIKVRLVLDLT